MYTPIQGTYVALPTPFRDGRLDLDVFETMIDRVADLGADGVLVAGTTGEVPTLNDYEHRSLIHAAVDFVRGRVCVMAGIGTNCTRTSVELARFAASCGADSLMAVTPYYNRPSNRGLLLHYGQIADSSDAPVVLYNVPVRTGLDLQPAVAAELATRHENIVAIKEASQSVERVRELVNSTDLAVMCGDDGLIFECCAAGAVGAISVAANLAPMLVAEIVRQAQLEPHVSRTLQAELTPLVEALSVDVNPVSIKAALSILGLCQSEVRAPLAPLEAAARKELEKALEHSNVIHAVQ